MASRKLRGLIASLGATAALLTMGAGTAYGSTSSGAKPAANPPGPLFTCNSPDGCVFPNSDFTGNYSYWGGPGILNGADAADGVWYTFSSLHMSSPNPGSITNKTGGCIYIYSKAQSELDWLSNNTRLATYNDYGYVQVKYSDSSCTHHPAPPS